MKKVTKKEGKKEKDPNAPKRATTGFMVFSNEIRPKVKTEHPDAKVTDLAKIIGEKWRGMTYAQKKPHNDKAQKDKDRYAREIAAYKAKK